MIRAILDTNLWISYLISKRLGKIDKLLERDDLVLLFSEELIDEFIEVAGRVKFRSYFSVENIDELLDLFDDFGEIVKVTSHVDICRDPKDNFLLALAKDGRADFLISADKDLLDIETFDTSKILSYSDFEEMLHL